MLDDNLAVPFQTVVLGVDATVAGVDLTDDEQIMAECTRRRSTQRIPIPDLPSPTPQPGHKTRPPDQGHVPESLP
jgi:hypothetical protein